MQALGGTYDQGKARAARGGDLACVSGFMPAPIVGRYQSQIRHHPVAVGQPHGSFSRVTLPHTSGQAFASKGLARFFGFRSWRAPLSVTHCADSLRRSLDTRLSFHAALGVGRNSLRDFNGARCLCVPEHSACKLSDALERHPIAFPSAWSRTQPSDGAVTHGQERLAHGAKDA